MKALVRSGSAAALRWLLRALWLALLPALLAALTFRYLVPSQDGDGDSHGMLGELARLAASFPAAFWLGLFIYYAVVVRYWSRWLPAAASWLSSPDGRRLGVKSLAVWCGSLGLAALAALLLRSQLYEPYRVLSASMLPTLEPSAVILVKPSAYRGRTAGAEQPQRGDVIVFQAAQAGTPDPVVKRVVGLAGDHIATHIGHPVINGWTVPSCNAGHFAYLSERGVLRGLLQVEFLGDRSYLTVYSAPLRPDLQEYTVPPGEVFLIGDNRNNSSDSRAWNDGHGGSLPLAAILGRVDRLLVGVKRNGDFDLASLFRPLGPAMGLDGLDASALRAGIERCRANAPKQTQPPRGVAL